METLSENISTCTDGIPMGNKDKQEHSIMKIVLTKAEVESAVLYWLVNDKRILESDIVNYGLEKDTFTAELDDECDWEMK